MFDNNCFITLTYNDQHLPKVPGTDVPTLRLDHYQKFMKRFRKAHKGIDPDSKGQYPVRFYMAGEYGEKFGRPHFHACIFNFGFDDKKFFKTTEAGSKLYISEKLQRLCA